MSKFSFKKKGLHEFHVSDAVVYIVIGNVIIMMPLHALSYINTVFILCDTKHIVELQVNISE